MDIICPRCAEPWDLSELHEVGALSFKQANDIFHTQGCGALFDGTPCKESQDPRAHAASVLYDLLGDDVDGIASMLEDAEYEGMFD